MKKIYLLILLVVSISFAADYQINLKSLRAISITNFTKKDLKGFKLYYYFNSRPVNNVTEFSYEITRFEFNAAATGGTTEGQPQKDCVSGLPLSRRVRQNRETLSSSRELTTLTAQAMWRSTSATG